MAIGKRAASSKTRKTRTTAMVQVPTNFIFNGDAEDSLISQRAQRLACTFGLTDLRARMIAALAWGGC